MGALAITTVQSTLSAELRGADPPTNHQVGSSDLGQVIAKFTRQIAAIEKRDSQSIVDLLGSQDTVVAGDMDAANEQDMSKSSLEVSTINFHVIKPAH